MSDRLDAKRLLRNSTNDINRAGTNINVVIERYQTLHPEISEPLVIVLQFLGIALEGIEQIQRGI